LKHVLFCVNSLRSGGAERQMCLLAINLPKDWQVTIFSLGGGFFEKKLRNHKITLYISPRKNRFDINPYRKLKSIIHEIRPDVVHTWDWMQAIAISAFCKHLKIAHVVGVIRSGRIPPRRWLGLLIASRSGNITIANSFAGLKAFRLLGSGKVVYNGIDVNRFSGPLPNASVTKKENLQCIMVASFLPSKDHDTLFKACSFLSERIPLTVNVPGEGPRMDELREKYSQLIDSGVLSFPGYTEDIVNQLRTSNIGILVSNASEGLSNSIMEYMGAGLPVICTNTGGNSELVKDGVNGFLIPKGDWKSLASKIEWFYENPDAIDEMGKKGKQFLLNNFSTDKMVTETLKVYYKAIKAVKN